MDVVLNHNKGVLFRNFMMQKEEGVGALATWKVFIVTIEWL